MVITTITEVKKVAQFTNEWDDDTILSEIDLIESDLYDKYYLPKRSQASVDSDYPLVYISPIKTYEIVRVQVAVDASIDVSGYLSVDSGSDTWIHTSDNNYITLGSDFLSTYDGQLLRVQSVPEYAHGLATYMTALTLVDPTTIVDGEESVPPLVKRMQSKIKFYKGQAKPKSTLQSSLYTTFNKYDYISYEQSTLR